MEASAHFKVTVVIQNLNNMAGLSQNALPFPTNLRSLKRRDIKSYFFELQITTRRVQWRTECVTSVCSSFDRLHKIARDLCVTQENLGSRRLRYGHSHVSSNQAPQFTFLHFDGNVIRQCCLQDLGFARAYASSIKWKALPPLLTSRLILRPSSTILHALFS